MMTADQIRLRLDRVVEISRGNTAGPGYPDLALEELVDLLRDLLPDLVALASGRTTDDAGRRYGGLPR